MSSKPPRLTFSQRGGPANVPWPGRTPGQFAGKVSGKTSKVDGTSESNWWKNAKRTVKMMKNMTLDSLVSHVTVHVSKIFSLKTGCWYVLLLWVFFVSPFVPAPLVLCHRYRNATSRWLGGSCIVHYLPRVKVAYEHSSLFCYLQSWELQGWSTNLVPKTPFWKSL